MKTLLPKLLFSTFILILSTFFAKAACTASFTKSISGLTVSFTNTSSTTSSFPNMMQYTWNFGDGTFSYTKNPVKTFSTPGTKIVQMTLNDSFGCTKTVFDTIVLVATGPTCNASFTKSISGLTVSFTNTSTSSAGLSNVHFSWYFSNGLTSTLANPVTTYLSPGMQVAQLTLYDSTTHCYSSFIDSILVTSPTNACAANFTKSMTSAGLALTNTSTNTNGLSTGLSYYWYFSDGTSSTLKNPTKTFTTNGYKTISLTITDSSQGCFSTKTDSIYYTAVSSCYAGFTRTISGLTVTITNTSLNTNGLAAGLSYYWYFSDGTSSTLQNPTKTFATGGYKTIHLTISDTLQGCFSSTMDTVILATSNLCQASYIFSVTAPLTVQFSNTSTNVHGMPAGLTYYWQFSDATTSTAGHPLKTFASAGPKWATVTITDSVSGCYSSYTDSFTLTGSTCSAGFTMAISGLTVTFTNTSVNTNGTAAGLTYSWNFGDGTTSTLKDPVKTYATGGIKAPYLIITDSSTGCYSRMHDTIVFPSSSCHASFTKTVSGLTITFTNTSLNSNGTAAGLNYYWTFGDGTTSSAQHPVKTYATSGLKFVTLYITDSSTTCFASSPDTVWLAPTTPPCQASFALATDTTTPFHFFLLNTSIIIPGTTYFWDFGDSSTSTLMTPTHTYANFGYYNVCLTISHSLCTSTFCDTIGMDSTGMLLKQGAFGFHTLDFTTISPTTGTKETPTAPEYSIYPNPSNGDVFIEYTLQSATTLNIDVTDITGKVVMSKQANGLSGKHTEGVDLADLQPAIYFMTIRTANMQKNYKLIRN